VQVAVTIPIDKVFDYSLESDLSPSMLIGSRVIVPFSTRRKVGVVMSVKAASDDETTGLKTIEMVLDYPSLLSSKDLELLRWASEYYHHPIGEVIANAFPVALRQGKAAHLQKKLAFSLSDLGRLTAIDQLRRSPRQQALLQRFQNTDVPLTCDKLTNDKSALQALIGKGLVQTQVSSRCAPENSTQVSPLQANPEQQLAIESIISTLGRFSVSLLQGVTGSGKTEVYMQIIAEVLRKDWQVLVLLPEITLTPQLEQRFRQRFRVAIVCSHSKLNDNQRLQAWLSMQQGEASILLGTRSALFTPLARPGLIILDEEHDSSFKQQDGFRFSARDVAVVRGKHLQVPVVLGSATPSLESLYNVDRQRYRLLTLSQRAGDAMPPSCKVLDIRNKPLQSGLSEALIKLMTMTLKRGEQVMLFLNRRGFAPVQICNACGWVARCPHCDANLVIHAAEQRLRCHHCGCEHTLLKHCPSCMTSELQALGLGTERIEQALSALFPGKKVVRLDRDTTKHKGALEAYLERINQGDADIILGTQMLAKGHHFPEVTLVALIDIDSGLFSIDYRAGERLAQMIAQVAGRAGRADKPGQVILQTRQPHHPLLTLMLEQGYPAFAKQALLERQQAGLPPYAFQALFRVEASTGLLAQDFLQGISDLIGAHHLAKRIQLLGPVSAPMARRSGVFRFQLLLQTKNRQVLHELLNTILPSVYRLKYGQKVRWSLDVDPIDLY
jgi:primosomal protein N' (replication factor Y)